MLILHLNYNEYEICMRCDHYRILGTQVWHINNILISVTQFLLQGMCTSDNHIVARTIVVGLYHTLQEKISYISWSSFRYKRY